MNLFYQESNTFGTVILKYFTKRNKLPKRPPKSTQAFQGETFELKWNLGPIFEFWGRGSLVSATILWSGFKNLNQPAHRYQKYTNLRFFVGHSCFVSFTSWSAGKIPHFLNILNKLMARKSNTSLFAAQFQMFFPCFLYLSAGTLYQGSQNCQVFEIRNIWETRINLIQI